MTPEEVKERERLLGRIKAHKDSFSLLDLFGLENLMQTVLNGIFNPVGGVLAANHAKVAKAFLDAGDMKHAAEEVRLADRIALKCGLIGAGIALVVFGLIYLATR